MKIFGDCIALLSADAAPLADALAAHAADVVLLPPCPGADRRIACHPDTLLAPLGEDLVLPAAYAAAYGAICDSLRAHMAGRMILAESPIGTRYPADIPYNILIRGRYLYGNLPHLAPILLREARERGYILRRVRQGYAGCAALAAGEAVITADAAIARAAESDGAAVLRISPGGIELPGYACGFIGGASGGDGRAVFFLGDVERHPDGPAIRAHLAGQGMEVISLAPCPLIDYGGIRFVRMRPKRKEIPMKELFTQLGEHGLRFLPGAVEEDFTTIEALYGIRFPARLREFYRLGIPTREDSDRFPRWTDFSDGNVARLRAWMRQPLAWLRQDLENGDGPRSWGECTPEALEERLAQSPPLIPLFGHRFLIALPGAEDGPVISTVGWDTVLYGPDLEAYLQAEFLKEPSTAAFTGEIPLWSDVIGRNS